MPNYLWVCWLGLDQESYGFPSRLLAHIVHQGLVDCVGVEMNSSWPVKG
jgi:hypothetical protein